MADLSLASFISLPPHMFYTQDSKKCGAPHSASLSFKLCTKTLALKGNFMQCLNIFAIYRLHPRPFHLRKRLRKKVSTQFICCKPYGFVYKQRNKKIRWGLCDLNGSLVDIIRAVPKTVTLPFGKKQIFIQCPIWWTLRDLNPWPPARQARCSSHWAKCPISFYYNVLRFICQGSF